MINVKIVWKNTNKIYEEKTLNNLIDLREDISKQTAYVLKKIRYQIEKTSKVLDFFKRTYYAFFYVEYDDYIELNEVEAGRKRYKNIVKKTNSNMVLSNTLERIEEMLDERLQEYRMSVSIIAPRMTKLRVETIKILFTDVNLKKHECYVNFDKISWVFKIEKVASVNPSLIIREVNKCFRYTTYPTRVYRKKHKVIQDENTSE
jgi:hypothetical protein